MPSEMRCVSWLILMIWTLTVWPMLRTSVGWLTRRQAMSVTCSRPSMPPRSTKAPYSVMFLTTPSMTWPSSRFATISERCSARLSSSTVRRETTMLPRRRSILRIWNGCGMCISGVDVAHRADVDLAARQEGHGAVEVDGEAALDLVEDHAVDALVRLERLLELDPALLAARLVARQHRLAERVLDALEIDLDLVADLDGGAVPAGADEFLEGDAAFGLQRRRR